MNSEFFTIIISVLVTFGSGFLLSNIINWWQNHQKKNKLTEKLICIANDFLKKYKKTTINPDHAQQFQRFSFPDLELMIYTGQLHYYDYETQKTISHILLTSKIIDDFTATATHYLFQEKPPSPSYTFKENYKEQSEIIKSNIEKLLKLLKST